jgi:hypothetical protein
MTLLERIQANEAKKACSRTDDPTEHDKPKVFVAPWRKNLRARDETWRRAA